MLRRFDDYRSLLATALVLLVVGYIGWKISQSPNQALQFSFNGVSTGAIYALLALGFTLVYSTVWFFDLYYGAAAAIGAYGVFYLRSESSSFDLHSSNSLYVNIVFAAIVAGVAAWVLHGGLYPRLRARFNRAVLLVVGGLLASGAGVYMGMLLAHPGQLHILLSPVVGLLAAIATGWLLYLGYRWLLPNASLLPFLLLTPVAGVLGAYCGLGASSPGANLYLSWVVSCLLAGSVSLALYRGLYVYMRKRANSPLVMLVASLGVLLAITAFITIIFQSAPRPLPEAFGSEPWTVGGANIKGFNVFTTGVALVGFLALLLLLNRTSFGKVVRAVGDDEEVAKVVGINTTSVIAMVFFLGAVYAALAGLLNGHDTAIQPRMGLLLLLKGWIASVVGGIGNVYGAILGGFALGMVEQFGIWDLAGEWKDAISFILLILFLSFWPKGLLPRR